MGRELSKQSPPTSKDVAAAEAKVAKAKQDLALEIAQIAADTAGIVDPTPISDGVSAAISVARGDWWGAALSVVSMVPYAGDAIAKPIKAVRASKAVARLKRALEAAVSARRQIEAAAVAARRKAASAIQRARAASAKGTSAGKNCVAKSCGPSPFGTQLPADKNSVWAGSKGDSAWTPSPDNPDAAAILAATGGKPIPFKNGFPDFTDFAVKHNGKPVSVDIDMKGYQKITTKDGRTMTASPDFAAANRAMKEIDPDWRQPPNTTWHHHENGTSMVLVPTDINNKVPHTGGGSIVGDADF